MRVRADCSVPVLVLVGILLLQACTAKTTWRRASELKDGIEDIVARQTLKLQTKFMELSAYTTISDLPCTGNDGAFCNINEPAFARDNPMLVRESQHSNIDGSCAAIDRDICGNPLAVAITGRNVQGDLRARRESCRAPSRTSRRSAGPWRPRSGRGSTRGAPPEAARTSSTSGWRSLAP